MRRIAISDIHGCLNTLQRLMERIELKDADELYFLGDFMDRGPDSKGVMDYMIKLAGQRNPKPVFIRGNHDEFVVKLYREPVEKLAELQNWLRQGGLDTLVSFGLSYNNLPQMPEHYIRFIEDMSYYHEVDNHLLVHAGFNFKDEGHFLDDTKSMVWIRKWYDDIDEKLLAGRKIIHGHTPTPMETIKKDFASPKYPVVNIDAGCCYHQTVEGMGNLCAYDFTNELLYFEPYCD